MSTSSTLRYGATDYEEADEHAQSLAALRGERLPVNIRDRRARLCIIHGIRTHLGFANSAAVQKLCSGDAAFARARNARLIMSDIIPEMDTDDVKPYCFWYPSVASEDTYRELVRRYPDLRYHAGRACAVANYESLYRDLELLPDVSIAEEAQDSGSRGIFDSIISQPVRYAVMNDYTRSVCLDSPPSGVHLNSDTAVRSSLNQRQSMEWYGKSWKWTHDHYFDITEDAAIDEHATADGLLFAPLANDHTNLLYTPLPDDLPAMNKDVLINMAAYEGNIDRYVRLRRPKMIRNELEAVVRGVYHHTTFARWWAGQLSLSPQHQADFLTIQEAVIARNIMNNDLSRIDATNPPTLPMLIWYPLFPQRATLAELARRRPDSLLQVALACVAADYEDVYDSLAPHPGPHPLLWQQAQLSANPHYRTHIELLAADLGVDLDSLDVEDTDEARMYGVANLDKEPTSNSLLGQIRNGYGELVEEQYEGGIYTTDGLQANAAEWELHISSTDEARSRVGVGEVKQLYEE